jgi:hypothetical protein
VKIVRKTLTRYAVGLAIVLQLGLASPAKASIPGLENFHIGIVSGRLLVSFVAEQLVWDYGLTVPIPWLPGATMSVGPDLYSMGTLFQFQCPLEDLVNHGKPLPKLGLPDGRVLPDVRDGALPRWDVPIRKLVLSLYLGTDVFALFVPLQFLDDQGLGLPVMITVPIEDEHGNLLGKVYAVPSNVSGKGSGLFLLLPYLGSPSGNLGEGVEGTVAVMN